MYQWRQEKWAKDVCLELGMSLDNLENDDKKAPDLAMAVKEASYIIGLHHEGGTTSNDMLNGEFGADGRKNALATIRACKRFIKKYEQYER